jgi:hypothetical protein
MKLNARELGTVLAALRYWQAGKEQEGGLWNGGAFEPIASDNGLQEPLASGEIDDLCQSLNLGEEKYYAKVEWSPEDVKTLRPRWSLKKCREWLEAHERHIRDRSTELTWEVIETLL